MTIENNFKALFTSMVLVLGLAGCDRPGPAETAGKNLDQATENVSNAVSNTAVKAEQALTKQGEMLGQTLDDAEITLKVKSALLNTPGLESMKISVVTVQGVVTLSGAVDNQVNKEKAIKATQAVQGVQSVKSELMGFI